MKYCKKDLCDMLICSFLNFSIDCPHYCEVILFLRKISRCFSFVIFKINVSATAEQNFCFIKFIVTGSKMQSCPLIISSKIDLSTIAQKKQCCFRVLGEYQGSTLPIIRKVNVSTFFYKKFCNSNMIVITCIY